MTGPLPCPVCGYGNRQGAMVCEDCGLSIPQYQACVACGFMNTADSRFCGNCGTPVGIERKQSAGPAAPRTTPAPAPGSPDDWPGARSPAGSPPSPGSPALAAGGPIRSPAHPGGPDQDQPGPGRQAAAPGTGPFVPLAGAAEPYPRPQLSPPARAGGPAAAGPAAAGPAAGGPPARAEGAAAAGPRVDPVVGAPKPAPASPQFKLVHESTGVEIRLPLADGTLVVGRPGGDPDVDVSGFPEATVVSRKHARVIIAGGRLQIEDLGSANGTYLNNARVRGPVPLADGDRLAFGQGAKVVFTVRLP